MVQICYFKKFKFFIKLCEIVLNKADNLIASKLNFLSIFIQKVFQIGPTTLFILLVFSSQVFFDLCKFLNARHSRVDDILYFCRFSGLLMQFNVRSNAFGTQWFDAAWSFAYVCDRIILSLGDKYHMSGTRNRYERWGFDVGVSHDAKVVPCLAFYCRHFGLVHSL